MTRSTTAARLSLVALLAATLLVLFAAAASAQSTGSAEDQMTGLINAERRAAKLPSLAVNVQLTGVARTWTPSMVSADALSHNPKLAEQVTGSWTRLGENVGVARPGTGETAEAMVERLHKAFMASPGHRANVLGDFEQVGLGVTWDRGNLWVTVNFMKGGERRANGAVVEATNISRKVFADAGASGRTADYAVLSRAEVFADSLGGAGLAGSRGPILFTNGPTANDPNPALHSRALAEIDRVLGGGGTVYLLGGTAALSPRIEQELKAAGYTPRRLAGDSRVETSVRVAEEVTRVHGAPKRILVARADEWPDAVTGGAYAAASGNPLVLSGRDSLHAAAQRFIQANPSSQVFALGGSVALSDQTVSQAGAHRVFGLDRASTAVAVAERLWGRTTGSAGDRFAVTPGWTSDAWVHALALAPWSAANHGPQLLVSDKGVPQPVADYLQRLGYTGAVSGDAFAASPVSSAITDEVRRLLNG